MKSASSAPVDDVAERGADRERTRQQQLGLRLDERAGLGEEPVDLVLGEARAVR